MIDAETLNTFSFGEGKQATNQNLQRISVSELNLTITCDKKHQVRARENHSGICRREN